MQAERTAPLVVSIAPYALTAETIPATGTTIGYTGLAWWGEDFAEHTPVSGPVKVAEHTSDGFYARMLEFDQPEIFVEVGDDEIRQMLHGFVVSAPSTQGSGPPMSSTAQVNADALDQIQKVAQAKAVELKDALRAPAGRLPRHALRQLAKEGLDALTRIQEIAQQDGGSAL